MADSDMRQLKSEQAFTLSDIEHSTVLAALRLLQARLEITTSLPLWILDIASNWRPAPRAFVG